MRPTLSICIPTLNRADFIGETLESIALQIQPGVEVVIVDGGSNDDTESVVDSYRGRISEINFIRRDMDDAVPSNSGFDIDCDHAVSSSKGEYCWLMTDDDILLPNSLETVLAAISRGYDLCVASCEVRDFSLRETLVVARPTLPRDLVFSQQDWEKFFRISLAHLTFVGAVIIRREIWIARRADSYFGTGFVHVGVIFSSPLPGAVKMIKQPLVAIRYGNAQWSARAFEIVMFHWPALVWSFPKVSDAAKGSVTPRYPFRSWRALLLQRAYGRYSMNEYQSYIKPRVPERWRRFVPYLIAAIPPRLLYTPAWAYGRWIHPSPKYFIASLDEGLRARKFPAIKSS